MRVLDVGCGAGEVTRMMAQLVGSQGTVIGIDSNESMLAKARSASDSSDHNNIAYVQTSLDDLELDPESFDAVVGRRILMYLQNATDVIVRLDTLLRPGGVMAFQEHDRTMTPGRVGSWPLHDQVHRWIWETAQRNGAKPNFGFSLPSLLSRIGLVVQSVELSPIASGYEDGLHHPLHVILGLLLPQAIAYGIAAEPEVVLDTLEDRLRSERIQNQSLYVSDMAISVVARHSTQ